MHSNLYQPSSSPQAAPTFNLDELFGSNNLLSANASHPGRPPSERPIPVAFLPSAPPPYAYNEPHPQEPTAGTVPPPYEHSGVSHTRLPPPTTVTANPGIPSAHHPSKGLTPPPHAGVDPRAYYSPKAEDKVLSSAISPFAHSAAVQILKPSNEDDDRARLEELVRLRLALEEQQKLEQEELKKLQTWHCAQCTFVNNLDKDECEVCHTVRPGLTRQSQVGRVNVNENLSATAKLSTKLGHATSSWQCDFCLAPNDASMNRCKVCKAFRKNDRSAQNPQDNSVNSIPQQSTALKPGYAGRVKWRCSICATVNEPSYGNCTACNGYQRNGIPLVGENNDTQGCGGISTNGGASSGSYSTSGITNPPLLAPTAWACSVCSLENPVSAAICEACESGQRPRHLAPPTQVSTTKLSASVNASTSSQSRGELRATESSQAGFANWPCALCTFLNRIELVRCDMCGGARPESYTPTVINRSKSGRKQQEESDDEIQWQENHVAKTCNRCQSEFGLMRRRHHCRSCGFVFCATCSPFQISLKKDSTPVRVCAECYEARRKKR